jgi:hypothetical protein
MTTKTLGQYLASALSQTVFCVYCHGTDSKQLAKTKMALSTFYNVSTNKTLLTYKGDDEAWKLSSIDELESCPDQGDPSILFAFTNEEMEKADVMFFITNDITNKSANIYKTLLNSECSYDISIGIIVGNKIDEKDNPIHPLSINYSSVLPFMQGNFIILFFDGTTFTVMLAGGDFNHVFFNPFAGKVLDFNDMDNLFMNQMDKLMNVPLTMNTMRHKFNSGLLPIGHAEYLQMQKLLKNTFTVEQLKKLPFCRIYYYCKMNYLLLEFQMWLKRHQNLPLLENNNKNDISRFIDLLEDEFIMISKVEYGKDYQLFRASQINKFLPNSLLLDKDRLPKNLFKVPFQGIKTLNQILREYHVVYCVDTSGSTEGTILGYEIQVLKKFINEAPGTIISWNDYAKQVFDANYLVANGTTCPQSLFTFTLEQMKHADNLVFFTDGEIGDNDVKEFFDLVSKHGNHYFNSIGIIFSEKLSNPSDINVSVMLPAMVGNGIILVFDGIHFYVIWSCGDFSAKYPSPDLTNTKLTWNQVQCTTIDELLQTSLHFHEKGPDTFMHIGSGEYWHFQNTLYSACLTEKQFLEIPLDRFCLNVKMSESFTPAIKWLIQHIILFPLEKDQLESIITNFASETNTKKKKNNNPYAGKNVSKYSQYRKNYANNLFVPKKASSDPYCNPDLASFQQ